MDAAVATAYDRIAYPTYTHPQTHPDRLASLARLFGMSPAPVERCRVLELGCHNGCNLIPMAYGLPASEFVGLELAEAPVADGQAFIRDLGLSNIRLLRMNVMEADAALGPFDYIIAHGFYSWVPAEVRDKALAICRELLADNGVAYLSYNAYPGSHIRRMVRDMMQFHVAGIVEPQARIEEARALLRYLADWEFPAEDHQRSWLQAEMRKILGFDPGHLYHDDLAEWNLPVYFHEFMAHAARHGLQYLAEADYFEMQMPRGAADFKEVLRLPEGDEVILREQYLDFLRCRRFRQTLLCRSEVPLDRRPTGERLRQFRLSSPARPVSERPDLSPGAVEQFRGPKGASLLTDHPLAKAALLVLGEIWPKSLRFEDLTEGARSRLANPATGEESAMGDILLELCGANLVELHVWEPRFVLEPGDKPQASRLARRQLETGRLVTNHLHRSVEITEPLARELVLKLDGTRDRGALLRDLGSPPAQALEANLRKLGRFALLEG